LVNRLEAMEKKVAEPPSAFSTRPAGVVTESRAIEPTTVRDMRTPGDLAKVRPGF
jgi:hypothetical protein